MTGEISKNGLSKRCPGCNLWRRLDTGYAKRGKYLATKCKACEARERSYSNATKACSSCKLRKPRDQFSRDRARKDGLQPRCKACSRKTASQYREKLECTACGQQYSVKANPDPIYCKHCRAERTDAAAPRKAT